MTLQAFPYFTFAEIGAIVVVAGIVLSGLLVLRVRLHPGARPERRVIAWLIGGLISWLVVAFWLSQAGLFRATRNGPIPPFIAYGIALPILLGLIPVLRSAAFGRVLDAVSQPWLVGVQLYRTLGVIFLVAYSGGLLPAVFALPAGYGDILVGVLALLVAGLVIRNGDAARRLVRAWNMLGIADLVLAVTLGFLSAPGPLQLLSLDAPNTTIGAFPMVMVPVFAVPLSILLHAASLRKLTRERHARASAPRTVATA